jgi:hypothetical protein
LGHRPYNAHFYAGLQYFTGRPINGFYFAIREQPNAVVPVWGARLPGNARVLGTIRTGRNALDITLVADRDDHHFFCDQILKIDFAELFIVDLCATLVAMLLFQGAKIFANDGENVFSVG